MARHGDGVVGCIGVCNIKDLRLFEDRRGNKRPAVVPISAAHLPSIRFKGLSVEEKVKLEEQLREKRNQKPLLIRRDIPNVKRMRNRRDRAKKASGSGEKENADIRIKLQEDADEKDQESSVSQITQMLYVICRILFVILGVGILIYGSVLLISLLPVDALYKPSNKTFEPVKPVKLTFKEWEEKRSRENQLIKE